MFVRDSRWGGSTKKEKKKGVQLLTASTHYPFTHQSNYLIYAININQLVYNIATIARATLLLVLLLFTYTYDCVCSAVSPLIYYLMSRINYRNSTLSDIIYLFHFFSCQPFCSIRFCSHLLLTKIGIISFFGNRRCKGTCLWLRELIEKN